MDLIDQKLKLNRGAIPVSQIQDTMLAVLRRQGRLWVSGVLVTIVLTVCIATFAFPGLLSQQGFSYAFNLDLAVRALIGLVLLFAVYTVYQHFQIRRIQLQLAEQIGTLGRLDRVEEKTEEAYQLAALDHLTGLYTRKFGEQRLTEEMSRSRHHKRSLTILMLDLNGLKQTNDTFGHAAGDQLLKFFAERLQKAVRGSDVPIRLSGDEFMVILPECKLSEVEIVLNRLKGLKTNFEGEEIPLEFAAGYTDYLAADSLETLMTRADDVLYANKRLTKEKIENDKRAALEDPWSAASQLSQRELQVLRLLVEGKNNKEVADVLNISMRTVEKHRANIMSNLGVHSFAELIAYVHRNGMPGLGAKSAGAEDAT